MSPDDHKHKKKNKALGKAQATPGQPLNKEEWHLHSEMLEHRIVRLDGEIDAETAALVNASIRYLEKKDPTQPIILMINSPGGYVTDGMSIVDTIRNCQCPIHTCVYGLAASMASVILVVGNKRFAAPHAEIMIHQPLGDSEGQQTEIEIAAHDMRNAREALTQIYAEETGLDYKDIDQLIERDYTMTADRAKQLGLIDDIMSQELYFKMQHNKKVPEWKKPRHPDSKRADSRQSIEDMFNEMAQRASANRKPSVSNDNGEQSPKKKKSGNPQPPQE
ncbi:MAG: ATP-dependent Clp protease proteolytic subunit [Alphaproteobacteria bacterium]|nr:ATP-dependent Clp protease proteolytic subunit [Alphaproteobacteria bacterium]